MTKELKFYKENYVTEAKMIAFGGERESVKITPEKRKKLQEILNREEDGDDIIPD